MAKSSIEVDGLKIWPFEKKTKNGVATYWRIKGYLPHQPPGTPPMDTSAPSLSEAKAKARLAVIDARQAAAPGAANKDKGYLPLSDLIDEAMDPLNRSRIGRGGAHRHAQDSKHLAKSHIRPIIGDTLVKDAVPSVFRRVIATLEQAAFDYADDTIRNVHSTMRGIVNYGMDNRFWPADYDPMKGVTFTPRKRAKTKNGTRKVTPDMSPSPTYVDEFVKGMRYFGGEAWETGAELAAYCGIRYAELLALTAEDFDIENLTVSISKQFVEHTDPVPGGMNARGEAVPLFENMKKKLDPIRDPKTGQQLWGGHFLEADPKWDSFRVIPVPQWIMDKVIRRIAQVEKDHNRTQPQSGRSLNAQRLLFCTSEGTIPYRSSFTRDKSNRAREFANWPKDDKTGKYKWSWHDLRHHAASNFIRPKEEGGYGLEFAEAAHFMGHSLETFQGKYVQPPSDFMDKAKAAMAEATTPAERRAKLRVVS